MEEVGIEEFKRCLPASVRGSVSDEIREAFNSCLADPNTREVMSQNLLGYTDVISKGKFKLENYISAVRYCTYKSMGNTNILAYKKTFPERYSSYVDQNMEMKDINSLISAYNKSKLVTLIYQSMMIPTYILNQDVFQEAINVQRQLMLDPNTKPLIRTQAAKALMDTLKPPEIKQMELEVSIKETDTMAELRKVTTELAKAQLDAINNGSTVTDIIDAQLVQDAEYEERS